MGSGAVRIFSERGDLLDFMVRQWLVIIRTATTERGFFAAALSGGKTPRDFFLRLSLLEDKAYWEHTHIFLADERCVPLDSPDSNYGLLRSSLLGRVPIPAENLHPVPVDPDDPVSSARKYEEELRYFFRVQKGSIPEFDFIHLGMGDDGHTASLFPQGDAVKESERLCAHVLLDGTKHNRVTLTLPLINNARNVFMLVTGGAKAATVKRVIEERDESLPAALVQPKGTLFYVLDEAAGSELRERR
jgi:6-phosphogluconolactonase